MALMGPCSSLILCLGTLCSLPTPCLGGPNAFLMPAADPGQRRSALVAEIREAFSGGRRRAPTEMDLNRIEEVLEPIFQSLPKNTSGTSGTLGATAARYALHRVFIQLHGWRVKGLDSAGEAWSELALSALDHDVPEDLRRLFEARLARGVDLYELTALAATLEHLFHRESEERLKAIFSALGVSLDAKLDADGATKLLDAYVATFVTGTSTLEITKAGVAELMRDIYKRYSDWDATRSFAREVRNAILAGVDSVTFEGMEMLVEEFSQRFGRWQNSDCLEIRADLIGLEERKGSGRVLLSDLYHASLHQGKWYNESPEYLQQQGALDNSEPEVPRVVIANYLYSPINCIAQMRYFHVCCIDECEDLIGHLERHFRSPTAGPSAIAALVATLPSSTVPGDRVLPSSLITRLEEIAEQHGGQVPLHGRLFAQWMHHAYPRECAYPHASGTTAPQSTHEFQKQAGQSFKASTKQMQRIVDEVRNARKESVLSSDDNVEDEADDEGTCRELPWDAKEELVDPHAHRTALSQSPRTQFCEVIRSLVFMSALGSMAAALARLVGPLQQVIGVPVSDKNGGSLIVHSV